MTVLPLKSILSIVVPCFNEEAVLLDTAHALLSAITDLSGRGRIHSDSFICFVDDGSQDSSWQIINELHDVDCRYRGIKLSRNYGHQNALLAGLTHVGATCDCAVTIDADLQQDIAALPEFLSRYQQGADLVLGIRNDRSADSFFKKHTAAIFYGLMKVLGVRVIKNHADYRLISKKALQALGQYREVNLFLRGVLLDLGFKVDYVYFDVRERQAGSSKYTFRKMLSFAFDGLTSFSIAPLRLVTAVGTLVFILSICMSFYVMYHRIVVGGTVPGWASIVLPIYLLGGLQIMSVGMVGEYIGKIYKEVKARPRFIIETATENDVIN